MHIVACRKNTLFAALGILERLFHQRPDARERSADCNSLRVDFNHDTIQRLVILRNAPFAEAL
jgi:hypothetical protein